MPGIRRLKRAGAALCALLLALPAAAPAADEGLWTFDNPPLAQLRERYGFAPSQAFLDHIRLASVRLSDGGSAAFVSPRGLLLTNHHVARAQLEKISSAGHNYLDSGYYAATPAEELKTPDLEASVLVSMQDVTARVRGAASRPAAIAAIGRESQAQTGLRSEVVSLYQGGEYWLYRYKVYNDVRLVFAPEEQAAFFGGDTDNFAYPRYDLDMALFRVYENGQPIERRDYLRWNARGAAEGDLVFVAGNPSATRRGDTVAQLEYQRDVYQPLYIEVLRRRIQTLEAYAAGGAEPARLASARRLLLRNALQQYEGELAGLRAPAAMAAKRAEEAEFQRRVMANPEWRAEWGGAWDLVAQAERNAAARTRQQFYRGLDSDLANFATTIVQYAAETAKPDGERMAGYREAQLAAVRFQLASAAPISVAMETARLAGALRLDLEKAGPDDAFVQAALAGRSPEAAAAALAGGTRLGDPAYRLQLIDGGAAAVAASRDPMIELARRLDAPRREMLAWTAAQVTSLEARGGEQLAAARFAAYGSSRYPDATFTLRLSYGQVKGYTRNGTPVPSATNFAGLYARAAQFGFAGPFALPARYLDRKAALDLKTTLNFVTTNDIVAGNSGSAVINRQGEIVGLIFDGNQESLAGDFVYDGSANRAVAVATAGMTEALEKLYGAGRITRELAGDGVQ